MRKVFVALLMVVASAALVPAPAFAQAFPADLLPEAEKGDAGAQYELGFMHAIGWRVAQDYAEAARWYGMAAEQGHAWAQYSLGRMYEDGQGVARDYAEAVKWYGKAARQGDARAQCDLGNMYSGGRGVARDGAYALMWFNIAWANGYKDAREAREELSRSLSPDQIAEAQKLSREWMEKHPAKAQ